MQTTPTTRGASYKNEEKVSATTIKAKEGRVGGESLVGVARL